MTTQETLLSRSGSKCELCTKEQNLTTYSVKPNAGENADNSILCCDICLSQIENPSTIDTNHWRCLNDSMWSTEAAVQVMAWRQLNHLSAETWAQDLLDMMYLEDDVKEWAPAGIVDSDEEVTVDTKDSNGTVLQAGDSVTIIKDLVVKGAGFPAKRGTTVKNISLTSNPEHIEGRVNGTRIVLVSAYLKKL